MRALVAILAFTALSIASLPTGSLATFDGDAGPEMSEPGAEADEDTSRLGLDDDVLHAAPIACSPQRALEHAGPMLAEDRGEGRVPPQRTRPPRSC